MSSPDRLYMVRSQFYIANFEVGSLGRCDSQTCIQEANRVTTTNEAENLEKTYFVYRSMICLGPVQPSAGANPKQPHDDERVEGHRPPGAVLRRA